MTLLVLSPWAVRNLRSNGELRFTDSHGGITALMGNYPNSEGTYARSLSMMFRELEGGRSFLSEPHRETDQIAYAMAKRWIAFQPGWTAGMMALRVERLFAQSAVALEDAAGTLLHAAYTFIALDGPLPGLFAEQAGALLAVAARFEEAADLTRAHQSN